MSYAELLPCVDVRWEDDRPFEVRVNTGPRQPHFPELAERIRIALAAKGWRVHLGPFEWVDGGWYACVNTAVPVRLREKRPGAD